MPDQRSIFDILSPQPPQGIGGALRSGVRSLSDYFAEATPALLQDEDVGFGGMFAASLFGQLGEPMRQQEARDQQRAQFALQMFPNLTPESQQEIMSTMAPGLELQPPAQESSHALKQIYTNAAETLYDPKAPAADKENALTTLMGDPQVHEILGTAGMRFADGMPVPSDALLSAMARIYTSDSIEEWRNQEKPTFGDWSVLEIRPDLLLKGGGGSERSTAEQLKREAYIQVKALMDANPTLSFEDAVSNLDAFHESALSQAAGQVAGRAPISIEDIPQEAMDIVNRGPMGQILQTALSVNPGDSKARERYTNLVMLQEEILKERYKEQGIALERRGGPRQPLPPPPEPVISPGASPRTVETGATREERVLDLAADYMDGGMSAEEAIARARGEIAE